MNNKTLLALVGAPVLALGLGSAPASAGEVQLNVHLGIPPVIYAPPVVVHPPVVYPAPVYYPPPVIYHQPPPRHHGGYQGHGHQYYYSGTRAHAAPAYRHAYERKGFRDVVRGPRHDGRRG